MSDAQLAAIAEIYARVYSATINAPQNVQPSWATQQTTARDAATDAVKGFFAMMRGIEGLK